MNRGQAGKGELGMKISHRKKSRCSLEAGVSTRLGGPGGWHEGEGQEALRCGWRLLGSNKSRRIFQGPERSMFQKALLTTEWTGRGSNGHNKTPRSPLCSSRLEVTVFQTRVVRTESEEIEAVEGY